MNYTILVAEDEKPIAQAIKMKLTQSGYKVIMCETGEQVLEKAEEADLILLDIIMPELDGLETLDRLQKKGLVGKKKVFMLTNLDRESDMETAQKLGASEYIVKSHVDLDSLIDIISKYLTN